jgi:hypothetical protein
MIPQLSFYGLLILFAFGSCTSALEAMPRCTEEPKVAGSAQSRQRSPYQYKLDDGRRIDSTGTLVPDEKISVKKVMNSTCAPYPERDASGRFGFKDEKSEWLVKPQFAHADTFYEGRAVVELKRNSSNTATICTYVKLNGQLLKTQFQTCSAFQHGVAFVVDTDGVNQIINREGDPLIDNTQSADWGHATASISDGLIALYDQESRKTGYANAHGEWVIQPKFAQAFEFREGLAAVRLAENGLVGFINKTGQLIIPFRYGAVFGEPPVFSEGRALVSKKDLSPKTNLDPPDRVGFIDRTGHWIVPARFTDGKNFESGLAHMYIGNKEYYIDRSGKTVWPRQKLNRHK